MAEVAANTPVPTKHDIPDFDKNWEKTKDLLPWFTWGWKESDLDSLMLAWQSVPLIEERIERLAAAVELTDIPQEEVEVGREYLANSIRELDTLAEGITRIGNDVPDDIKWAEVKPLFDIAESVNGTGLGEDEQAIALLEEIHALQKEGKLPKNYKRLVAQWGLTEIMKQMQYDIYEYTAAQEDESESEVAERSTQDSLDEEKSELKSALRQKTWTKKEKDNAHAGYLGLLRIIREDWNDVPEETHKKLKKLWDAATKEGGDKNMAALDILQLTEDVYVDFKDNGGFDIDLNEYAEEDEYEEDEEEEQETGEE